MDPSEERKDDSTAGDALAALIRAAGRRAAPPREHYTAVRAASRAAWQAKLASRRRRRFGFAAAAGLVVLAGAAVVLRIAGPGPSTEIARLVRVEGGLLHYSDAAGAWLPIEGRDVVLEAGDRLRTGADGRAALALESGVSLRIDSATTLGFTAGNAVSLERGRIYIDSGEGVRTEAIAIDTRFGLVRDIGTQFEVRAADDALRVRIRSGLIRLTPSGTATDATIDRAGAAGEELELAAGGEFSSRPFATYGAAWQWVEALAVPAAATDLKTIREYCRWISRETGRELRFDSLATEMQAELEQFRGRSGDLSPLELLDVIAATSDFEIELTDGGAIVVRRPARDR